MEDKAAMRRLITALKSGDSRAARSILNGVPREEWPHAQMIPFVIKDYLRKRRAEERSEYLLSSFALLFREHTWSEEKQTRIGRVVFFLYLLRTRSVFKQEAAVSQQQLLQMFNAMAREFPPGRKLLCLVNKRSLASVNCRQRRASFIKWLDEYRAMKLEAFYAGATLLTQDIIDTLYHEDSPKLICLD